jgi:hypothetical protein
LPNSAVVAILTLVRKLLGFCLILLPLCSAHGQEQERKLVDRIMKPDMTLENDAQKKKFTADRTSVNKRAHVNTFYWQQKSRTKAFSGTRDFGAAQVNTGTFNQSNDGTASNFATKKSADPAYVDGAKSAAVRSANDQNKSQGSRQYAASRPYLEQGKSQKSLNRKNRPMTIDEVRELLNKNK